MRLIDADALMKTIRTSDYPLKSHSNSTDNGMFTIGIQQAVDEQPTVEGIEIRRRGAWIYGNGNGECPFCRRERQFGWDNFCGFCGAYMKGEQE